MIAWAGGARLIAEQASNLAIANAQPSVSALVADRAGSSSGRIRGFAAGSLLACGSVLAVAAHAGDVAFGPFDNQPAPAENKLPPSPGPGTTPTVFTAQPPAAPAPVRSAAAPQPGTSAAVLTGSDSPLGAGTSAGTAGAQPWHAARPAGGTAPSHSAAGTGSTDPLSRALAPLAPVVRAPARAVEAARTVAAPVTAPVGASAADPQRATAPARQQGTPVQQLTAPVQQLAAPVQRLTAPVQQLAAPVQRLAAPVQQLAAPVQGLAAVGQVVAPVQQLSAPVQRLVSPQPSASPEEADAPLEEGSQPAMSMLPGSGLDLDAGVAALGGLVSSPAR